jgi:L-ribulose-5-phosphate 4-epimerase
VTATTLDHIPKFKFTLKRAPAPEITQVIAMEKWRALFFKLGLVGEYPNEKISYGTFSSRITSNIFLITGSNTGHLAHLHPHHYARVCDCDLKKNSVTAEGLIPPSADALIHYGIYASNPNVNFIFSVRSKEEGIVAYGANAEDAGKLILNTYKKLSIRQ